jgi:hypothetical protein
MLTDIFKAMNAADKLKICEKRSIEANYIEIVFYSADAESWLSFLESFLGKAVKPAGKKPETAHSIIASNFGGIRGGQTLFAKEVNGVVTAAMLWPWSDEKHITLKAFSVKSSSPERPAGVLARFLTRLRK